MAALAAVLFLPFLYIVFRWAPIPISYVIGNLQGIEQDFDYLFYLLVIMELVGPYVLALSVLGFLIGIVLPQWRQESYLLLVFLLVHYLTLSLVVAREHRYGLLLCVPILCFCAIAIHVFAKWLGNWLKGTEKLAGTAVIMITLMLCSLQVWTAKKAPLPSVHGIREVAAFLERVAPNESIFYDGYYSNVFTFYIQAGDPAYTRRVVLGAKLLYASAIEPLWRYRSFVSTSTEVVQVLHERGGCRWLAVEKSKQSEQIPAALLLRKAVQGSEFELVRSFPVSGSGLDRIDVYRFKMMPKQIEEIDLPFPILGEEVHFKARPIQR
jgi:hypothetical protein